MLRQQGTSGHDWARRAFAEEVIDTLESTLPRAPLYSSAVAQWRDSQQGQRGDEYARRRYTRKIVERQAAMSFSICEEAEGHIGKPNPIFVRLSARRRQSIIAMTGQATRRGSSMFFPASRFQVRSLQSKLPHVLIGRPLHLCPVTLQGVNTIFSKATRALSRHCRHFTCCLGEN